MTDLYSRALAFATKAHEGQTRRYTGEPYINHPIAVAGIVQSIYHTEAMVAAALLHDVVEDTAATNDQLESEFGFDVAYLVRWLTDISTKEDGNRAVRKAMDRDWIASAPPDAKTIKLADLIDNTATIRERDPEFWKVYRLEKLALLEVLRDGDATLWARAAEQCGMEVT